jgi:hypothetical protein
MSQPGYNASFHDYASHAELHCLDACGVRLQGKAMHIYQEGIYQHPLESGQITLKK